MQPTYGVVRTVDVGSTASFAVLGKAVFTAGSALLVGNVVSASAISGTPVVTGTAYLSSGAVAAATLLDLQTAVNDASSRAATRAPLAASLPSGTVLLPGVYSWEASLSVVGPNAVIRLDANRQADAVWIFQVATTLAIGTDCRVEIINNVTEHKNVFWSVRGGVTIGARSHFVGTVLGQNAVTAQSGALTGPLFSTSQTSPVTVNNAVVVASRPEASVLQTRSPSAAPTDMSEPSMEVSVTSSFEGFSGAVNPDGSVDLDQASQEAVVDAFGAVMNISTSDIAITGAHILGGESGGESGGGGGSRRNLQTATDNSNSRNNIKKKRAADTAAGAVAIVITTLIKVHLVDYPQFQANTTTAFQTIVHRLRSALDSRALTDQIVANAVANGADALLAIVLTAVNSEQPLVQFPPSRQPTATPRDDDGDGSLLADGPTAGVVIGVLLGTALLLVALYVGLTKYRESTYPKEYVVNFDTTATASDAHVIDVLEEQTQQVKPQQQQDWLQINNNSDNDSSNETDRQRHPHPHASSPPPPPPLATSTVLQTPYGPAVSEPGLKVTSLNEIEIGL